MIESLDPLNFQRMQVAAKADQRMVARLESIQATCAEGLSELRLRQRAATDTLARPVAQAAIAVEP